MKISIFIPTTPNHISNVKNIIDLYNNGTRKPDEIIVSVSESNKIDKNLLKSLESECKLIKHDKVMLAGPNRQVAKDVCT